MHSAKLDIILTVIDLSDFGNLKVTNYEAKETPRAPLVQHTSHLLFDEKNETIQNWCDLMVNSASNSSVLDESVASADQDSDLGIFLLSSWKTLLIVLSKEQPIVISPVVCHKIIDSLVEAIRGT